MKTETSPQTGDGTSVRTFILHAQYASIQYNMQKVSRVEI